MDHILWTPASTMIYERFNNFIFLIEFNENRNKLWAIFQIAPTFAETAFLCKFQDESGNCDKLFHETWTDEGLCFTFNSLDNDEITSQLYLFSVFESIFWVQCEWNETKLSTPRYHFRIDQQKHPLTTARVKGLHRQRIWSLENGYDRQNAIDSKAYPYEILGDGQRGAFAIILRLYTNDLDFLCRGPVVGFKISLHLPGDLPQMSSHFVRIPNERDTLITINPEVVRTAKSLRSYSPNARGCYYSNERTLKYFKEYTQRNCELECLTDHTLENCRCVKFSMPREWNALISFSSWSFGYLFTWFIIISGDEATAICGFENLQCMTKSQQSIIAKKLKNITTGGVDSCNCLPACTQITYNHEISQADLHYTKMMQAFDAVLDSNEKYVNSAPSIWLRY